MFVSVFQSACPWHGERNCAYLLCFRRSRSFLSARCAISYCHVQARLNKSAVQVSVATSDFTARCQLGQLRKPARCTNGTATNSKQYMTTWAQRYGNIVVRRIDIGCCLGRPATRFRRHTVCGRALAHTNPSVMCLHTIDRPAGSATSLNWMIAF
jgi:hypothetical protein